MTTRQFPQRRFSPPPDSCEILLVRHGESAPYVDGVLFDTVDGHGDPPLAPEGIESAELVAARLADTNEQIAAVYVTTLQRTQQTAAPLLRRLGMQATVIPDLREIYLGEWEGGLSRTKFADQDPIAVEVMTHQRWDLIPGAESNDEFSTRVSRGVDRIASAHLGETVVAVVHGGVIGQIIRTATGSAQFAFGADNASITHLVVTPDSWIIRCFNDTGHLWPTFSNSTGR